VRCWAWKLSRNGLGPADSSRSLTLRSGVRGLRSPKVKLMQGHRHQYQRQQGALVQSSDGMSRD
jgi:hypothetical protein